MDETEKLISKYKNIYDIIHSEGWKYIDELFTDRIMLLQNIDNLPDKSPEEVLIEIKARKLAKDMLIGIVRELVGDAQSYEDNKNTLNKNDYIQRD